MNEADLTREAARLSAEFRQRARSADETEEYSQENVDSLQKAGLMGMTIPIEMGGAGVSLRDAVRVVEEISRGCGVTGRIVVDSNFGAVGCVMAYGPDWMRRRVAELVLGGDKPAIQISEPEAGTDAGGIATRLEVRGDEIVINGEKRWITGAHRSKVNVVVGQVFEDGERLGIGAVYVEGGTPGYQIGERLYMMGLRGMPEMQTLFQDCVVPRENLIVVGMRNVMAAYNAQRLGSAAVALGIASSAFEQMVDYMKTRTQFGARLAEFQGLRWKAVDCELRLESARLLIERASTVGLTPEGFPDSKMTAFAKIASAEAANVVTNEALQIHGAKGYWRGLEIERLVRDARMFTIGGGTVEALRNLCAKALLDGPDPAARPAG